MHAGRSLKSSRHRSRARQLTPSQTEYCRHPFVKWGQGTGNYVLLLLESLGLLSISLHDRICELPLAQIGRRPKNGGKCKVRDEHKVSDAGNDIRAGASDPYKACGTSALRDTRGQTLLLLPAQEQREGTIQARVGGGAATLERTATAALMQHSLPDA